MSSGLSPRAASLCDEVHHVSAMGRHLFISSSFILSLAQNTYFMIVNAFGPKRTEAFGCRQVLARNLLGIFVERSQNHVFL